jgi:hypothetical protein
VSALFRLGGLAKPLQIAVQLYPLVYGVDGMRGALSRGFAIVGDVPPERGKSTRSPRSD